MTDVLLVFARFPELGTCKTRLIPELGAAGATRLHEQMTQHTLTWARQLASESGIEVRVFVAGGDTSGMAKRFGDDLLYQQQLGTDLGQRLTAAFRAQMQRGADRIVVVGTDCPQLTSAVARTAFARLGTHDACIAPAIDGGYTLLGLRTKQVRADEGNSPADPSGLETVLTQQLQSLPFQGIDWGSGQVLMQTLDTLHASGHRVSLLPTLADVDSPNDIEVWKQAEQGNDSQPPLLTVVVPTLNEEPLLASAIASALADRRAEVIVVASGQTHSAARVAARLRVQLLQTEPGRAHQMNLGAEHASADKIVFLHADTLLPVGYVDAVLDCLGTPGIAGGAFRLRIDATRWAARAIQAGVQLRSKYLSMPYGDQALFVRKCMFAKVGGFTNLPIMEDFHFVRRLKSQGRVALVHPAVVTSARRWQKRGYLKTTLINQLMIAGYYLGIPIERLARFYRGLI